MIDPLGDSDILKVHNKHVKKTLFFRKQLSRDQVSPKSLNAVEVLKGNAQSESWDEWSSPGNVSWVSGWEVWLGWSKDVRCRKRVVAGVKLSARDGKVTVLVGTMSSF